MVPDQHSISEVVREATAQCETAQQKDSIPAPREHRVSITKYGDNHQEMMPTFNDLSSPYYFRAVRSFGEYRAERGENWPSCI